MREESDFIHEIFFTYFLAIIGVILVAQHLTEMRFMIWSKRVFTKIINREFHLADLSGTLIFYLIFGVLGVFCVGVFLLHFSVIQMYRILLLQLLNQKIQRQLILMLILYELQVYMITTTGTFAPIFLLRFDCYSPNFVMSQKNCIKSCGLYPGQILTV